MDVLCTSRNTSDPIRLRDTTVTVVEQISDILSEINSYPNSSAMSPTASQSLQYPTITETVQTKPFPIRGMCDYFFVVLLHFYCTFIR